MSSPAGVPYTDSSSLGVSAGVSSPLSWLESALFGGRERVLRRTGVDTDAAKSGVLREESDSFARSSLGVSSWLLCSSAEADLLFLVFRVGVEAAESSMNLLRADRVTEPTCGLWVSAPRRVVTIVGDCSQSGSVERLRTEVAEGERDSRARALSRTRENIDGLGLIQPMQARKSSNTRESAGGEGPARKNRGPGVQLPVGPVARVWRALHRAIIFAMLSQQLPRRIARQAIAWPLHGNNVCILCRSANVFQRHYAKPVPARAPSTRRDQWRNRSRVINDAEKQAMRAALLPEPGLIQYLKEAGLIQAEPSEVMEVLGKMRDLGSELNGVTTKKLCLG